MNAKKQKKILTCLISTFEFQKKYMTLKLFEFQEQLKIVYFLKILTRFEKTGSLEKLFFPLGNLKIKFHSRNVFSRYFSFYCWRGHLAYLQTYEPELNSKSAYKNRAFICAFLSMNALLL